MKDKPADTFFGKSDKAEAYSEGYDAFKNGVDSNQNPYLADDTASYSLAMHWHLGWNQAAYEACE
jgi:hypothetical protein